MNQPVPIDHNARLELVQGVIFNGTPSQVTNLPAFIKGFLAAVIVIVVYLYAMMRWPVQWFVPALALLLIGVGVVVAYLRTAFTEIVIDTARITLRQGIFSRQVQSLELFRIQDVTSLHPWWRQGLAAAGMALRNLGVSQRGTTDELIQCQRLLKEGNDMTSKDARHRAVRHVAACGCFACGAGAWRL